ncbi:putative ribonuclease H protein [Glycine max]|nr:putative ribonuclease H protein [Glycine max]
MLCLQETKEESIDKSFCQYLWGDDNVSWEFVPSISAAGGLLCLWDNDSFVVDRRIVGRGYILLEGTWTKENKKVCITNVYAPCDLQGKRQQWEEIKILRSSLLEGLWCVVGDFNSIRHQHERISSSQSLGNFNSSSEFNSWISDMALEEVRSVGRIFTWYRPNGTAMSRLDRFLLSDEWLSQWPDSTQFVLDRDYSDHCPILLRSRTIDWGPRPFKIMDWWLQDKEFQNMVRHRWGNYHPSGWGGFALKMKLKFIKSCIRHWSSQNGVINASKIQNLKKELNALEAGGNASILSQAERDLKKSLQEQLWNAAHAYESMLRQKSRVKWIKEGDRNSAYFHRMINHRRRFNAIRGLIIADNIRVLKSVLRIFEMVSGLKINYAKSQYGCLGKSESWCREAALFLNCGQLDIPFSYLGIPVGTASKNWNVWQPIISKFEFKLSKWKQKCLSMGGRITLINSVLTALPIYLLSFFKVPKKVVNKLVSIQRNFLWGGGSEAAKIAWVNWDTICLPKNKGGLAKFNEALLDSSFKSGLSLMGGDPAGHYSTKSAYNLLKDEGNSFEEDSTSKIIWRLKIPPRASAFSWRIFKNRLPTRDNLRRRHVELPSYNCPLCDQEEETAGHILFSCRKTRHLWWESLRWVNREGPFSIEPKSHFLQFSLWSGKSNVDKRWEVFWIALSMSIWKHRNALVFHNQDFNSEKVMDEAVFHTWSWINSMEKDFHTHFNQWSSSLKEEMS